MTDHTTHYNDCGCLRARLEAELAAERARCEALREAVRHSVEQHNDGGRAMTNKMLAERVAERLRESGAAFPLDSVLADALPAIATAFEAADECAGWADGRADYALEDWNAALRAVAKALNVEDK